MGAVDGPVGPVTLGLAGGRGELRLMQQRHPPRKHALDPADPGGLIAEVRPLNARRGLYGGADCLVVESPRKGEGVVLGRLPAQTFFLAFKADQHTDSTHRYRSCADGANVLEFIVETESLSDAARTAGTVSVYPELSGNIAAIEPISTAQ